MTDTMTTARAPTKRFEQRKTDIVTAAIGVINRKGMRGATLAEVAAKLNLVPTGVIYYFKNKEELAAACYLHGIGQYRNLLSSGEAAHQVGDRLDGFLKAYFNHKRSELSREVDLLAAFNDVRALNSPAVNDAYVGMFRHARELFVGPETAGLSRVELNARALLLMSEIFWTVVWLHRHDVEDYDRVAQRFSAITTGGLAPAGAVWNPIPLPPLGAEGDDSAEMFLRAATQLINEEGYLGASVEKISARLNVTKGAFYHHNETKDELVVACFERTFEVMRRALRQAEQVSSNGYQTLITAAAALVDYQMTGQAPLLRTSALTSSPESLQPELVGKFDRISDRFAALISDGIADGSIRPVDANIAAQMLTAMINTAAELHHWTPGMHSSQAGAVFVRPFFEGLLSASAA